MRFLGLDVHRDFCEVAIAENGVARPAGQIKTSPAELELFACSLAPSDVVAMEATANALAIARIIEPHVARVVLANPKAVKAATGLRAKTDKIDARTLAQLLAGGFLAEVWTPDEQTRVRRRLISRRGHLVRQMVREKNQVHAVLQRQLKERPPMTDMFGVKGRVWLASQQEHLPVDEQQSVNACLRQIDFVKKEIELVDVEIAKQVLASEDIRRLMTLPGVSGVTATAILAAIGDVSRFPTPGHLVGYLGLSPRVHQSGSEPAKHGRISKQGPGEVRGLLVESAWHAARTTGPLRAFHQRVKARRGANIATVAVARKLVVIAWNMLRRSEDYAFARPSLHREKLRRFELLLGAQPQQGKRLRSCLITSVGCLGMARTWFRIRVDLLGGRGVVCDPSPGRVFLVGPSHSFEQFAEAIDAGFARWDLAHLHNFELRDGRLIGYPDDSFAPEMVWLDHAKLKVAKEVKPGDEFEYVFDLGDNWQHRCIVESEKGDPIEEYGIVPGQPVVIWGWGSIPDQYGRRSFDDDGED